MTAQIYKRGLNHTENVEEDTGGETCLANSGSKFISVVCNVCYNVREVILLDKKLQFCHLPVISSLTLSSTI